MVSTGILPDEVLTGVKLLLVSDIDDLHWRLGEGQADLVLSLGDVADQVILEAATAYKCSTIFAVRGNHDYNASSKFPDPVIDLHMTTSVWGGMTFGGLNGAWRYKSKGHYLYDQSEVCRMISTFPAVDVMISHNSPRGIHDRDDGIHLGFEGLTNYILEHRPKYLFHGHQHYAQETQHGDTRVFCIYGAREMEI